MARWGCLLVLLAGLLSISGCIGLGGAPNPSSQNSTGGISLSPSSISFGSVAVGSTVSQSVRVSNSGSSDITVTQVSTAVSGFNITGTSLPVTIGPGKQSTFNVIFSPTVKKSISGIVSVMSSASSSPSTIAVSGTGAAATTLLDSSASSLSFGNVAIGASSILDVTLKNAGNSNVNVSGVSVAGARFATSGVSAGLILAPGQNATLQVSFSPSTTGSLTGSVTVASNATNSPVVISLSGTGFQPLSHSVGLAWTASTSTVAGYNVYRSTVSGGSYTKLNSSSIASTSYKDSTVLSGQTYYYAVTSVTAKGVESSYSSPISTTIPIP